MNIRDCDGDPITPQLSVAKRHYGGSSVITCICPCIRVHFREKSADPLVSCIDYEIIFHNLPEVVLRSRFWGYERKPTVHGAKTSGYSPDTQLGNWILLKILWVTYSKISSNRTILEDYSLKLNIEISGNASFDFE